MSRNFNRLIVLAPLLALACGNDVTTTGASATGGSTGSTSGTTAGTSQTGEPTTTEGSGSGSLGTSTSTTTEATTSTATTTSEGMTSTTGDSSTTDTTTGGVCVDADADGHGVDCPLGPDCDDADPNNHTPEGCANCLDIDGDGAWAGCDQFDDAKPGPDCDDTDANNQTPEGCAGCVDMDGDGHWVGCDQFGDAKPGPDCDDADFNNHTPEGCAGCIDMDGDGYWVGCDQYDEGKLGPDCDDGNPVVGISDQVEVCNGIAENCAGEIDPLPADEMCPTKGDPPNVDSWLCDPPEPGVDGCKIASCAGNWFDINNNPVDGCECAGTDHKAVANPTCAEQVPGMLGPVSEGDSLNNLPTGTIPELDNGIGGGAEDWYWVEFPLGGVRPNTGSIRVDFSLNENLDYRFEVYRNCNGVAWAGGLATQFGVGAPPAREWWFFDNHAKNANYTDNVTWPSKVYIRVFRVQNNDTCNKYRLRVQRVDN